VTVPVECPRIALIGYGIGGAIFHAPIIAAVPELTLTAIVTANPERAERAARDYPAAAILPSADDLWARAGDVDAVVIATPNRLHVPLALAALDAGLAVVVDKPFAATARDARRVIDEARRRNLLLTVFHNRRWDGDFLTVRSLIAGGALGDVWRFESRFERWRTVPREGWRERGDPDEAGGLLYDLGTHLIDQALVLFGPVADIYAEIERRRPGAAVDDDTFVALKHASGVRSHLWMSATAAQGGPRFRVLGSRAAYTKYGMDVQEDALRAGARPDHPGWGEDAVDRWGLVGAGDAVDPVPTERGAYEEFYRTFARSMREGAPPPVDPEDAVRVLDVIESIHAAR
jgi:predicted dehydrogenase